jgi:hypothetical protein
MAIIRNELEHKYLKLHEMLIGRGEGRTPDPAFNRDRIAFSISRREFEIETLSLLRRARAAIMYLTFAVRLEEQRRDRERSATALSIPVVSDMWSDEWKI